MFNFDQR